MQPIRAHGFSLDCGYVLWRGLANSTSPDQLICFVVETFGIDHDIDNP